MFKLFKKDLNDMEEVEVDRLNENARKILTMSTDLRNLIRVSDDLEKQKQKGGSKRKDAEKRLKENSEFAKNYLREILRLLHNEEQEAMQALEDELKKQFAVKKKS